MPPYPIVILQLTDLHILKEPGDTMSGVDTEYTFKQVLEYALAKHKNTDLILLTGDLTQDPHKPSYQRIYQELKKHHLRSICFPGNHDDLEMMQQVFSDEQINCNKHIKFKDWQIICLNSQIPGSHSGRLNADELDFLRTTLDTQADLNTLVAVHHHPVPTNSQWMDTMLIENSDELFSLLENYPQVKVMICGHIHQQLEIEKQDIAILGTPSTCFQFTPQKKDYSVDITDPGYRLIELYPNGRINSKIYYVPC